MFQTTNQLLYIIITRYIIHLFSHTGITTDSLEVYPIHGLKYQSNNSTQSTLNPGMVQMIMIA